jgi:hypothetical protein
MSESLYPMATFALGMVLTATFLTLGLWVGYKVGRASKGVKRGGSRKRRWGWLRRELAQCANLAQQCVSHSQRMKSHAASGPQPKSQEAAKTARQLAEHAAELCERLQKLAGGAWSKSNGKADSAIAMAPASDGALDESRSTSSPKQTSGQGADESHSSLSAQELGQFTEFGDGQGEAGEESNRRRFAYDCVQSVIPWLPNDTRLPTIDDGVTVRCHDISGQGISFFWPSEPDFEHLIISLGNDQDLLFMAAHVMHFKPIDMHGVTTYLVGCRFIRRMNELTLQWQRELRHGAAEPVRATVSV